MEAFPAAKAIVRTLREEIRTSTLLLVDKIMPYEWMSRVEFCLTLSDKHDSYGSRTANVLFWTQIYK
jgi:hypothetical protein